MHSFVHQFLQYSVTIKITASITIGKFKNFQFTGKKNKEHEYLTRWTPISKNTTRENTINYDKYEYQYLRIT